MKLFVLVLAVATCCADRLNRGYLPPAGAPSAGGSPGAIEVPGLLGAGQYQGQGSSDISTPNNNGGGFQQVSNGNNYPTNNLNIPSDASGPQGARVDGRIAPERAQAASERSAGIIRQHSDLTDDSFSYAFETENGISAEESGTAKNGVVAKGSFSYTGDDANVYSITYTADENGFRPEGAHLPTPPPVPQEILRALEQNARDEANGIFDDGSYDANKYGDSEDDTTPQHDHRTINTPAEQTYNAPNGQLASSQQRQRNPATSVAEFKPHNNNIVSNNAMLPTYKSPVQYNAAASPQYNVAASPQHNAAASPQYHAAASPQYNVAASPQHNAAASPQYHAAASPQYNVAASPQHNVAASPQYNVAASPQHNAAASPHYSPATSSRYNAAAIPQYNAAKSPQYNAAKSPQYNAAKSPQNNAAASPQYNAAANPQYNPAASFQYNPAAGTQYNAAASPQYPLHQNNNAQRQQFNAPVQNNATPRPQYTTPEYNNESFMNQYKSPVQNSHTQRQNFNAPIQSNAAPKYENNPLVQNNAASRNQFNVPAQNNYAASPQHNAVASNNGAYGNQYNAGATKSPTNNAQRQQHSTPVQNTYAASPQYSGQVFNNAAPRNQYNAPSQTNYPTTSQHIASVQNKDAPNIKQQYSAPVQNNVAPSPQYNAPAQKSLAPSTSTGTQEFGAQQRLTSFDPKTGYQY